jgi:hypothetical protein
MNTTFLLCMHHSAEEAYFYIFLDVYSISQ